MFSYGVLNARKHIKRSLYGLWHFRLSWVFVNLSKDSWASSAYCNVMNVNLEV